MTAASYFEGRREHPVPIELKDSALPFMSPLEPSPRAQALEEAAKALEAWGDIYGDNAAKCVRALSSQPVADGWKPIETAPKDGTQFLAYDKTNGYYNCWWHKSLYGEEYWMDMADTEPNPIHWRPLPASPGASE